MPRVTFGHFTEEETAQTVKDGLDLVTDETAIEIIVQHCKNAADPLAFTQELLAHLDELNSELGG